MSRGKNEKEIDIFGINYYLCEKGVQKMNNTEYVGNRAHITR